MKKTEYHEFFDLLRTIDMKASILIQKTGLKGLSPNQGHVVGILFDHGPCPMKFLAERLYLSTAAITKIIDRLEKEGLVQRCPCGNDRRKVIVEATAKGKMEMQRMHQIFVQLVAKASERLSETDLKTIEGFYRSLDSGLTEMIQGEC